MKDMFKQRWFWITVLFAMINIVGLIYIVGALESNASFQRPAILSVIGARLEALTRLFHKKAQYVQAAVKAMTNELAISEIKPAVYGTDVAIVVRLNESLGKADTKGYVDIKPPVKFFVDDSYAGMEIKGDFKPGQTYHVEILAGLKSEYGAVLKEGYAADVVIPDYEPTVRFKVPGMYLGLKGNRIIPVEAVNLSKVHLAVQRLYDNNVVYFLNNTDDYRGPQDIGVDLATQDISIVAGINVIKDAQIDLKSILPDSQQGLFYITASDPAGEGSEDSKLVLVTDIGILLKKGPRELLVWACSLQDTTPVAGATVKVLSKTNQLIVEGQTDENGLMRFRDVDLGKGREPFVVTVSKDKDLSYLEVASNTISETDFDIKGRPYLSAGYAGFIYSDRGVYRPGEKANVRTILRAPGVKIPDSFPVIFEIFRPDGKKLKDYNAVLNKFGTADIAVEFPDYALTGEYKIALKIPGNDKPIGAAQLNVEEFVPDSLKVTAQVADKRFAQEDVVPVGVNVQQNFGAPAAGRDLEVSYNLKAVKFEPKDYQGFSFYDDTRAFTFKREYLPIQKSDENGNAAFEIKLGDVKLPPSALEMSLRVTAQEIGGRSSSVYEDRSIDVYPYYVGLKSQIAGNGVLGQDIKFDYVTLWSDGTKATTAEVSADVCKVIWSNLVKKNDKGEWQWITESREDCFDHQVLTPQEGEGIFAFTPQSAGDYVLRLKGAGDKAHAAAIKFFVEGSGVVSWAKERPDRIDLAFDKNNYAVGETAQLTIKSPLAGKGLLTCATDKVILSKTLAVGATAQQEAIPVTEEFAPNAYCSLTVIRPVTGGEQWTSHRGYGIVPIMLNNAEHKTVVEVSVPGEARANDMVKLDIQGPAGQPMEFSVALVDDAILRLTGYKTPDPYEFFYGKRANGFQTSDIYSLLMPELAESQAAADSSPSGDMAYNAKHSNPVNAQRVQSIALWQSQVVTDADGKAQVKFTIPEFNGQLKWIIVGSGESAFVSQEGAVKVVEPVVVSPFLPRFLSLNDEFLLPVSVSNMTKEAGEVVVTLEVPNSFTVTGENKQVVTLDPDKAGVVTFKLQAPAAPQKGDIKISASLRDEKVSRTTEIAVRPPVGWITLNGVLEVPAGSTKQFAIPAGWLAGTAQTKLIISGMPSLKISGGLGYLLKYPYGCIEQTTSTVFPLLYLRDLAMTMDSRKYNPETISKLVNAGIERVISMQTLWGGFAMWQGERREYPFGSIYATDFLVEADKAGYAVPQFAKILALGYLEGVLAKKDEAYTPELKAYAAYVLSKAGRINASWIRRLQEMKDKLPAESRCYVAAALSVLGDRKAEQETLGQSFPDEQVKRELGGNLMSYVRQNAVVLSVYMDLEPQNAMVPVLVSRLEKAMTNGQWASTQENAQALIALGKYARYFAQENIEFNGTVKIGEALREFTSHNGLAVSDLDIAGKMVEVAVVGKGTAYVYWTSEGIPTAGQAQDQDSGIKIRRVFLNRAGKSVDLNAVKHGETVVVDLTIEGAAGMDNIVVEDLLPAGFEIENPRLKTTEKMDGVSGDLIEPVHMDIRDDRLVLFLDVKGGVEHYRYIVRAVTKGGFVLPAVKAEEMYDPSIFSVHGQGRIQVVE